MAQFKIKSYFHSWSIFGRAKGFLMCPDDPDTADGQSTTLSKGARSAFWGIKVAVIWIR